MATACALALALGSCGQDRGGRLQGSLDAYYDIEYERVRARLYPGSELAIEYVREDGEVPVRVTARQPGELPTGQPIDLTERGALTGRVRDTDIPQMSSGSMILEQFSPGQPGSMIVGEWSASFDVSGDELGLRGTFEVELEVVEQIEGYEIDLGGPDMGDMGAEEMGAGADEMGS